MNPEKAELARYSGQNLLHLTGPLVDFRDRFAAYAALEGLRSKPTYVGNITREQLLQPVPGVTRDVFLAETIGLAKKEAIAAGLIPESELERHGTVTPRIAQQEGLYLPFSGGIVDPDKIQMGSKLHVHPVHPATLEKNLYQRGDLSQVQELSWRLKKASPSPVFEGWTAIDEEGREAAAYDLMRDGMGVIMKWGYGSAGQGQVFFYNEQQFEEAKVALDAYLAIDGKNWREPGVEMERLLDRHHDSLGIGSFYYKGELISWIGIIGHQFAYHNKKGIVPAFSFSTKIYVKGPLENFLGLPLPEETLEDLAKIDNYENALTAEDYAVFARLNFNHLRGKISIKQEGAEQEISPSIPIYDAGTTEVTSRDGGSSPLERRVLRAYVRSNNHRYLRRAEKEDMDAVHRVNGHNFIVASTIQEYFRTREDFVHSPFLSETNGMRVLYVGYDKSYNWVRGYNVLHKDMGEMLTDKNALRAFFYPNLSEELRTRQNSSDLPMSEVIFLSPYNRNG